MDRVANVTKALFEQAGDAVPLVWHAAAGFGSSALGVAGAVVVALILLVMFAQTLLDWLRWGVGALFRGIGRLFKAFAWRACELANATLTLFAFVLGGGGAAVLVAYLWECAGRPGLVSADVAEPPPPPPAEMAAGAWW